MDMLNAGKAAGPGLSGAVCRGQIQLAKIVERQVDGVGVVNRGRGQSPFSTPPVVVGSVFFCRQFFEAQP